MSKSAYVSQQVRKDLPYTVSFVQFPDEITKFNEQAALASFSRALVRRDKAIARILAPWTPPRPVEEIKPISVFSKLSTGLSRWFNDVLQSAFPSN